METQKLIAKIEITVKFSELPQPTSITPQLVTIKLIDGAIAVIASVKPRQYKKLVDACQQFPLWVAALTGKPFKVVHNSIELVDASIQVFEKKPKVVDPATDKD